MMKINKRSTIFHSYYYEKYVYGYPQFSKNELLINYVIKYSFIT